MLLVSDVWERALHAPAAAGGATEVWHDVMTVAVVARPGPREQESVITMTSPPQMADPGDFPVASP